jgi:hypothetical protein
LDCDQLDCRITFFSDVMALVHIYPEFISKAFFALCAQASELLALRSKTL